MPTVTSIKPQKSKKRVNIYIDESGIGRKVGVSVYCITLSEYDDISYIDTEILKIEEELRIPPFHWREHSWKIKTKFLRRILNLEGWKCIVLVIDNTEFNNQLLQELLAKALQGVNIYMMYIDGKKTKTYTNSVKKSLKNLGVRMSSLKLVKHSLRGGLRISDAVAGLVRLNYDKKIKKEGDTLFRLFTKEKITTQILSGI